MTSDTDTQPKRRGRPPLPRDADGNIIKNPPAQAWPPAGTETVYPTGTITATPAPPAKPRGRPAGQANSPEAFMAALEEHAQAKAAYDKAKANLEGMLRRAGWNGS